MEPDERTVLFHAQVNCFQVESDLRLNRIIREYKPRVTHCEFLLSNIQVLALRSETQFLVKNWNWRSNFPGVSCWTDWPCLPVSRVPSTHCEMTFSRDLYAVFNIYENKFWWFSANGSICADYHRIALRSFSLDLIRTYLGWITISVLNRSCSWTAGSYRFRFIRRQFKNFGSFISWIIGTLNLFDSTVIMTLLSWS